VSSGLLERMRSAGGFEQVIALSDSGSGLRGFVVIHDTSRGPATGGIRLYPYASEDDALSDGFRLARAMTFKAAAADLPVGGGKIVLLESPDFVKKEALPAVGRAIESLGGRFLAGRDVGVPIPDATLVRSETGFMVDESETGVSDLNRATAVGVLWGARAALGIAAGAADEGSSVGDDGFRGLRVVLQGAGGVGSWLARLLADGGAELLVSDSNPEALEELERHVRFRKIAPDCVLDVDCDLFAPCAIGGVLDRSGARRLRARVVAGSANNVLASIEAGDELFSRGVVYAPDFLVNAGALIQGTRFLLTGERASEQALRAIGERTRALLSRATETGIPPQRLLEQEVMAKRGFDRGWRRWFVPSRR
jgi:leucine dehydrogenase